VAATKEIGALLLEHGARVDAANKQGQTPMLVAVYRGNKPVAELLEAKGARHTIETLAALGRDEELRRLLEKERPAKVQDPNRPSPLHLAAGFGQLKAARVLIDHG